jgi:uncharacterized protein YbjT (DUF2867 family)
MTDATGFVGRELARELASQGNEFRCLLRTEFGEQRLPTGISLQTASASLDDSATVRAALQGVDCVIHLVGDRRLQTQETLLQHPGRTANLVDAMQDVGVDRLIYISRLGANRGSAYELLRFRGEAEAIIEESGLKYSVLQASVIFGPEDISANLLVMVAKMLPWILPIPEVTQSRFQPVCISDLVRCVLAAVDSEQLIGQTLPIGGLEHFTFDQLVDQILVSARMKRRVVHLRMPVVRFLISIADLLLPNNPMPAWWLDILAAGSCTELLAIPRLFGFDPQRMSDCTAYLQRKRRWRRDLLRLTLHGV